MANSGVETDNLHVGGVDGKPFMLTLNEDARFVRITLLGREYFHLDEVEIYGVPEG